MKNKTEEIIKKHVAAFVLTVDFFDATPMYRVGKSAAGRLLDGREWNEMPGGVS